MGPGDVTFAAYVPSGQQMSFPLPIPLCQTVGTGTYAYTYLVVGWYSDPQAADPMRGVTTYIPGIWKSQEEWQQQSPVQRFPDSSRRPELVGSRRSEPVGAE